MAFVPTPYCRLARLLHPISGVHPCNAHCSLSLNLTDHGVSLTVVTVAVAKAGSVYRLVVLLSTKASSAHPYLVQFHGAGFVLSTISIQYPG